jgi:DNA-binding IclR family transcriptional regulator
LRVGNAGLATVAAAQNTGVRAIARQLRMPPSSIHEALQLAV